MEGEGIMKTTVSKSDMEELHSLLHIFLGGSMNKVKWTEVKWKSLYPALSVSHSLYQAQNKLDLVGDWVKKKLMFHA